jgi:mannan endo-1,4-beta-mannosidase
MLAAYHLPKTMLLTLLAVGMTQMSVSAQQPGAANANSVNNNNQFVQRDGTRLTLGGETFRFGGPNIEWLGLESYGPFGPMGPRYPSQFEIDDALDTAKAMGATVIRSQTMGDGIGDPLTIEPKVGQFNPDAFKHLDYVLKAAHDRGLRLVITLVGDDAYAPNGGASEYYDDPATANLATFFTDPQIIARFEEHISALLNHKNSLTGIAYKDDPTIMAWQNCNGLGTVVAISGGGVTTAEIANWVDVIGYYIKAIDKHHLYEDNSGLLGFGTGLNTQTPDIITSEYYPHWSKVFGGPAPTAATFQKDAALVTSYGKVYVVTEFGWDNTDWTTRADLEQILNTFKNDPNISGDLYWALQAHVDEFGWQPIPANVPNKAYDIRAESGQWWALYYGGIKTLVNTKADMAARAELLRSHAYEIAGLAVPPHAIPPTPVITQVALGSVSWRGSAGAVKYTIEREDSVAGPWQVVDDNASDEDTPWVDPNPPAGGGIFGGAIYRVTAYNADGVASAPSAPR